MMKTVKKEKKRNEPTYMFDALQKYLNYLTVTRLQYILIL